MELNGRTYFEKKVMTIHVVLDPHEKSVLVGKAGRVVMLPFRGTVDGEIFNGIVLPGGCDTQVENLAMVRHMSARYMLEGTDCYGQKGKIYIENNGWFTDGSRPRPFVTVPTFYTDCDGLADYLHTNQFITKGLAQVTNWVKLKFAAMNLKKFAIRKWEDAHNLLQILIFWPHYAQNPSFA